jgi:hypothetical protein
VCGLICTKRAHSLAAVRRGMCARDQLCAPLGAAGPGWGRIGAHISDTVPCDGRRADGSLVLSDGLARAPWVSGIIEGRTTSGSPRDSASTRPWALLRRGRRHRSISRTSTLAGCAASATSATRPERHGRRARDHRVLRASRLAGHHAWGAPRAVSQRPSLRAPNELCAAVLRCLWPIPRQRCRPSGLFQVSRHRPRSRHGSSRMRSKARCGSTSAVAHPPGPTMNRSAQRRTRTLQKLR